MKKKEAEKKVKYHKKRMKFYEKKVEQAETDKHTIGFKFNGNGN